MKAILFILLLILPNTCHGLEIKEISLWLDAWSHHAGVSGMNEHQYMKGFCLNEFCYVDFINSFGAPGSSLFVNGELHKAKHTRAGLRFGLVWGYETSPMSFLIPYVGVGYKHFWLEGTILVAGDGSNSYLAAVMAKVVIFEKDF
jgi:hypothetical protein